jgi:hypothetical protein
MFAAEDIQKLDRCASMQEARRVTLELMFRGLTIADRRAQLRAQVAATGTVKQLSQQLWSILLNREGFRNPTLVKARRGIAYDRR